MEVRSGLTEIRKHDRYGHQLLQTQWVCWNGNAVLIYLGWLVKTNKRDLRLNCMSDADTRSRN
jgi:hypothetical protein